MRESWVDPDERARLLRLSRGYLGFLFGALAVLFTAAVVLPPTWTFDGAAVLALALFLVGILFLVVAGTLYSRMMRSIAVLTRGHREGNGTGTGAVDLPLPSAVASDSIGPVPFVLDLGSFREARRRQSVELRSRGRRVLAMFAALSGITLAVSLSSILGGDLGNAAAFALVGALTGVIAVLWALLLYAPDLPTHATRMEVDARGVSVRRSRGSPVLLPWTTPGLRLFVIDTRTSTRLREPGSPFGLSLCAARLPPTPITDEATRALRDWSRAAGFALTELPQGTYGPLRIGVRVNLPFGSTVSVIERPGPG